MMLSKILVGIDHSPRSDKALRRANELALFHDSKLVLDYVIDVGTAQRLRGLIERVAIEEADARAKEVLGDTAAPIEVRASGGRPYEALRDAATELGAGLIVLGVHRREGSFGGSTARRLINVAPTPVLVVTDDVAGMYENVLVGFDRSPASYRALRYARELAPTARITVLTACMIPFSARKQEATLVKQFEDETRVRVKEALGEELANVELVVRAGEAFGVIRQAVDERKPDLLALGTSMSEAYRFVFGGGIVDLVAADPPCDLLVTKV